MRITRQTFLKNGVLTLGALWAYGATGCSGGDGQSYDNPGSAGSGGSANPGSGTCAASIEANHGHSLVVSPDDVTQAVDKTYDIQGSAAHSHSVTITAADFADLSQGQSLVVTSTETSLHSHTITVSCA
jgi:hypothetical protein